MRPKTAEEDRLEVLVQVRTTKLEKRLLLKRCKREGYRTLSDFCRAKLIKRREIRKVEVTPEFVEAIRIMDYQLNKIGVNLNQLSKAVNTQTIYQFTAADRVLFQQLLKELRNCFAVLQDYMDIIE
jgi:hypothetical protein